MEGVTLPGQLKAGDQTLILNGAGVREKLWWDLYVGGLYLTKKSQDDNSIINASEPMAVKMHIISSMITSDRMKEAIREGFDKSTDGNPEPIQDKIDQLINTFQEEIKVGDIFDLVYVPDNGVQAYKNGKLAATISGFDFKKALFGIWLSDDPVDKGLKEGMLGTD
jgi:hypothetical protein